MAKKRPRKLTPNPAVQRAADAVESQVALAEKLGVTPVTVNQWIKGRRPVPVDRCVAIERVTDGRVTRKDLRADWAKFWPELAITG